MTLILVYPLQWPAGRDRTLDRQAARFRSRDSASGQLSFAKARNRLADQLARLGAVYPSLSNDIRHKRDGSRDRTSKGSEIPADPGAAVRFRLDDRDYELACDRWESVAGNVAAIAAHIDALRGQERWGVADLRQSFAGHIALPAPDPWWQVLGVQQTAARPVIDAAHRALAKVSHPTHPKEIARIGTV